MARKERRQQPIPKVHLELLSVQPLTDNQKKALQTPENGVFIGAAGTGKTFLAAFKAFKAVFKDKTHKKVIIFRSAVATRNIGFLPGTEEEKMAVYEAPYIEIARVLFGRGDAYQELKKKRIVEFCSTSYPRGRTIDDAIIIVDEAQNLTYHELDSIITRAGANTKIYFSGDTLQADLPSHQSGLTTFCKVLKRMDSVRFVEFGIDDIVRGPLVKEYLTAKYQQGI